MLIMMCCGLVWGHRSKVAPRHIFIEYTKPTFSFSTSQTLDNRVNFLIVADQKQQSAPFKFQIVLFQFQFANHNCSASSQGLSMLKSCVFDCFVEKKVTIITKTQHSALTHTDINQVFALIRLPKNDIIQVSNVGGKDVD